MAETEGLNKWHTARVAAICWPSASCGEEFYSMDGLTDSPPLGLGFEIENWRVAGLCFHHVPSGAINSDDATFFAFHSLPSSSRFHIHSI